MAALSLHHVALVREALALELVPLFPHNVPKMSNNPSIHAMQPQQNSCLPGAGSQEIVINVKRNMRKIYGCFILSTLSAFTLVPGRLSTRTLSQFGVLGLGRFAEEENGYPLKLLP